MKQISRIFMTLLISTLLYSQTVQAKAKERPVLANPIGEAVQRDNLYPRVKFETSLGDVVIELRRDRAPITVNNFLTYVKQKEYDNTLFHRIIGGYIVQGGGYDLEMKEKPTNYKIINESGNGLKNTQYSIAMARMSNPHSAMRQFFFNIADNENLDPNRRSWGYTVFGEVFEGQEIIDAMAAVATHVDPDTGLPDSPVNDVILKKVIIVPEPKFD